MLVFTESQENRVIFREEKNKYRDDKRYTGLSKVNREIEGKHIQLFALEILRCDRFRQGKMCISL